MEQNEIIHTASNMANRFTTLNLAAKSAEQALHNVRSELFEGVLSADEKNILFHAITVVRKISEKTASYKATKAIEIFIASTLQKMAEQERQDEQQSEPDYDADQNCYQD